MTGPQNDPNFAGVTQPAFDALVRVHTQAALALEQLAPALWTHLTTLKADTAPAEAVRQLAAKARVQAQDLQRRQALVRAMEQPGSAQRRWVIQQPAAHNLSWELRAAAFLPPAQLPPGYTFSAEEQAVLSWIQAHQGIIIREARARNISPKAIVAAIAWEALENRKEPSPGELLLSPTGRVGYGPGKVHYNTGVVRQIESRGYLPEQELLERIEILHTPEGSIKYIAAIMGAFADATHGHGYDIRNNNMMLTYLYQAKDLENWDEHMIDKLNRGEKGLDPQSDMAFWTGTHADFLNAALPDWDGTPPTSLPLPTPTPPTPRNTSTPAPGTGPTPP
ncbi:hypothetical protein ACIBJE_21515 [Micromonospora sp. NPDC050187]|uniref:hypothetical protein n=1 Tax=Micromonospora sp. NPDC050187 TaxID=3364277 RepID=UPI0037901212